MSFFIDSHPRQIEAAAEVRSDAVELHTGGYAEASDPYRLEAELTRLRTGARRRPRSVSSSTRATVCGSTT